MVNVIQTSLSDPLPPPQIVILSNPVAMHGFGCCLFHPFWFRNGPRVWIVHVREDKATGFLFFYGLYDMIDSSLQYHEGCLSMEVMVDLSVCFCLSYTQRDNGHTSLIQLKIASYPLDIQTKKINDLKSLTTSL